MRIGIIGSDAAFLHYLTMILAERGQDCEVVQVPEPEQPIAMVVKMPEPMELDGLGFPDCMPPVGRYNRRARRHRFNNWK